MQLDGYNGQDPKVHDPTKVMYEHDGDANCPVKSLQLYLSKLDPNCEALFKRPKSKYTPDGIWYENAPVGKIYSQQRCLNCPQRLGVVSDTLTIALGPLPRQYFHMLVLMAMTYAQWRDIAQ